MTSAAMEPLIKVRPPQTGSGDEADSIPLLPSASDALLTMQCCLANVKVCRKKRTKNKTLWKKKGEVWQSERLEEELTAVDREMCIQDSLKNFEALCSRVKLSGMAFICEDAKLNMEELCDIIMSFKAEFDQFDDEPTRRRFGDSTTQILRDLDHHFVNGMLSVSPARTAVYRRSVDRSVQRVKEDDHSFYSYSLASLDNLFGSSAIVHYESTRFEDTVLNFHSIFYIVFSTLLFVSTICICSYILTQFLFLLIVHMSPGSQSLDPVDENTAGHSETWIDGWKRFRQVEPMLGFLSLPVLIVALAVLGCETYHVITSTLSSPQMARTRAFMIGLRMESKQDTWKGVEDDNFWRCLRDCMYEMDAWFVFWFDIHVYLGTVITSAGTFMMKKDHSISVGQVIMIVFLSALYPGILIQWQHRSLYAYLTSPRKAIKGISQTKVKLFHKVYQGWELVAVFAMWCILCTCLVLQTEEAYAGYLMGGTLWALATTCCFMLADIVSGKLETKGFVALLTGVLQDRMVKPGHMYSSYHEIKRKLRQQMRLRAYDYPKKTASSGFKLMFVAFKSKSDTPGGQFVYVSRFILAIILWGTTCIYAAVPEETNQRGRFVVLYNWRMLLWSCMVLTMFFMVANHIRASYFPEKKGIIEFYAHVMESTRTCCCNSGCCRRRSHKEEEEEDSDEEDVDEETKKKNENIARVALFNGTLLLFWVIWMAPPLLIFLTGIEDDPAWFEFLEGALVMGCLLMTLWAVHCFLTDLIPNLSWFKSNHVDPLSQGASHTKEQKEQKEYLDSATGMQRRRLVNSSKRKGGGSAGKFVTRKGHEQASFNAYCLFFVFYTGLCALFLFVSRIDVERFGAKFEGDGFPYYQEDPEYGDWTPYSDGWEGAPNMYPVCEMTWGAPSLHLRVLDLAALARFSYSSNESVLDNALDNTFSREHWKSVIGTTSLRNVTAEINVFEDIPRLLKVKFESLHWRGENRSQTTYVIAVKGSSNSLEFSADACIYSGVAILQFFSQFVDMFDLVPNQFLASVLKYVRVPRVRNLEKVIIDKVVKMVEDTKKADKKAQVLITGHSLGGGIAAAAGSITGTQTVVFSAPGYHFNRYVMGTQLSDAFRSVINIWPESDVVPLVDRHDETVQRITCRAKDTGSRGSGDCHLIDTTICELWRVCGDYQKRNLTEYCDSLLGPGLRKIEASRDLMIETDGSARAPETQATERLEFLWVGWWYLFVAGFLLLCVQAPLQLGFGSQCNFVVVLCLLCSCCCRRNRVSKVPT